MAGERPKADTRVEMRRRMLVPQLLAHLVTVPCLVAKVPMRHHPAANTHHLAHLVMVRSRVPLGTVHHLPCLAAKVLMRHHPAANTHHLARLVTVPCLAAKVLMLRHQVHLVHLVHLVMVHPQAHLDTVRRRAYLVKQMGPTRQRLARQVPVPVLPVNMGRALRVPVMDQGRVLPRRQADLMAPRRLPSAKVETVTP